MAIFRGVESVMTVYTVHEPPLRSGDSDSDPARFAFVRDGFYWGAFFFSVLWMLWHRLWLVLLGFVVVVAAVAVALGVLGATAWASAAVGLLLAILLGIEASTLRRWTLTRRGWTQLGVVVADDRELAERRFFDAWAAGAPSSPAPPLPSPPPARMMNTRDEVIGLFPQPGARP
jgi:Protein of unknown function (DUF2628)